MTIGLLKENEFLFEENKRLKKEIENKKINFKEIKFDNADFEESYNNAITLPFCCSLSVDETFEKPNEWEWILTVYDYTERKGICATEEEAQKESIKAYKEYIMNEIAKL